MVERRFRLESTHSIPEGTDYWSLVEFAQRVMPQVTGRQSDICVYLRRGEGTIRGATTTDVRAEVEDAALDVSSVRVGLVMDYKKHPEDLDVIVQPHAKTVAVEVNGKDEAQVRGWLATMDNRLEGWLRRQSVAASPASPPVPPPARIHGEVAIGQGPTMNYFPAPVAASAPAVKKDSTREWLATTWRDHTATLLITVIGGVLAVALAVFFGFGGGG